MSVTVKNSGTGEVTLSVDSDGMTTIASGEGGTSGADLSSTSDVTLGGGGFSNSKLTNAKPTSSARKANPGAREVNIKTSFVKSDVVTKGNVTTDTLVKGGNVKGSKFNSKGGDDSIQFRGASLKNTKVNLGKGADTVTFKNSEFAKRTTVDLGAQKNAKADVVNINKPVEGGKIVIENFDEKDTLKLDGKKYSYDDLTSKPSPTLDNIKIKFDD